MLLAWFGTGVFGAAITFGFRHGFDWDHIAAITDITGSQAKTRRSIWLATLYAAGHACMVLVLGTLAILFSEYVPDSVDTAMERVVGISLIALGVWIAWTALTTGGAPPLRSRWMLLLGGMRRLAAARRRSGAGEEVVIEHNHPHDHDHPIHGHLHLEPTPDSAAAARVRVRHAHTHRHSAAMPGDPFVRYTNWTSFGIGLLHGVGAETPTQVLVFGAAASASGRPTGVGILLCFVAGLLASNTLVAVASTLGFRSVLRNPFVAGVLAALTAGFSLVIGSLLVFG